MGTCEETLLPCLQTDNLMSPSSGTYKYTTNGDDRGEQEALVQRLESAQLEEESKEVGVNVDDGDVVVDDDDDDDDYGDVPDSDVTHPYPVRPHAMDCSFYLKTGNCKFGPNCRFNHPLGNGSEFVGDKEKDVEGFSEDVGKIECKYYLSPGGCKYGDACRFNHLKTKVGTAPPELNFLGLPIRLGEKECVFYLRNGSCGYGENCRFHHPAEVKQSEPDNSRVNGQSARGIQYPENYVTIFGPQQSPGVPQSPVASLSNYKDAGNNLSYLPAMNSFPQGMPPSPGWNQYQPDSSRKFHSNEAVMNPLKKADFIPYHQQQSHVEEFPERPGLPECEYFMKTGNCKYKSACRYHHPKSRLTISVIDAKHNLSKAADSFVHQQYHEHGEEFPERPGQPECDYFMKTGDCKFKSACRYDHPKNRISNVNGLPTRYAPNPTLEPSWMSEKSANDNKKKGFKNHLQLQAEEFPERPGEPECEYYMKTGNCKYKSACRFDHPKNRMSTFSECALSVKGLPLRPGSKICRHYEQHGTCRYGRGCLFDHPDDYSSSTYPAAAAASETPDPSYPDAPRVESAAGAPAAESSRDKDHVTDDWGDGWVM